jgi:hypothetical protein
MSLKIYITITIDQFFPHVIRLLQL